MHVIIYLIYIILDNWYLIYIIIKIIYFKNKSYKLLNELNYTHILP